MDYLDYKGYQGTIELQVKKNILSGKIAFIVDSVAYKGNSRSMLKKEFEAAVDRYLEACKRIGKEPDKPIVSKVPA